MEKLWSAKTLGLMSSVWLVVRLAFIALTFYFLTYSCDSSVELFLRMLLYSTIISVFFQCLIFSANAITSLRSYSPKCKRRVSLATYIYFGLDYGVYGLFRFIIVIMGAAWLSQAGTCDNEVYIYTLVVIIVYFVVFWGVCWIACLTLCSVLWDTYTL